MTNEVPSHGKPLPPPSGWSTRILLLALAGIFFLTLFPFRLTLHANLRPGASPFLLGAIGKPGEVLDVFLNILLFMPFGFGLSEKLREQGWSRGMTFFAAWIAGTLLSYSIEFTQIYIPTRDSRWEDVLTNQTGAIAGFVLFELCGRVMVRHVSKAESVLRTLLTVWRAALILILYFALCFTVSAILQKDTRLSNWGPQSQLFVGSESQTRLSSAWKGSLSRLQLWDQPVSADIASALAAGEVPDGARTGLLASYDFSSPAPLKDQMGFLPELSWVPNPPPVPSPQGLILDGRSFLRSSTPSSTLAETLQKTNHFSLRVVCIPAETGSPVERIFSIAQPSGLVDMYLRQENANLVFWFRNPLSVGHASLAWNIPNAFIAGQARDILFSYNGANLSLYINGRKDSHSYSLGPGARLAELIRWGRPPELDEYNYAYDALIFIPAGALLGLIATRKRPRDFAGYSLLAAGFLLPPLLFELILAHTIGRSVSLGTPVLTLCLLVSASLWINADRSPYLTAIPTEK
jgi:glycopeptide antibiotics resistance protein